MKVVFKVFNVVTKGFMISFLIFLTIILLYRVTNKERKPIFIFNHSFFRIMTSSMEPDYKKNSFIVIKNTSFDKLKENDVIVFKADALNGKYAFHRIVEITNNGLKVKGDNNNKIDIQLVQEEQYIGKCVYNTNTFCNYIEKISNKDGFILFFVLPSASLLMLYLSLRGILIKKGD